MKQIHLTGELSGSKHRDVNPEKLGFESRHLTLGPGFGITPSPSTYHCPFQLKAIAYLFIQLSVQTRIRP